MAKLLRDTPEFGPGEAAERPSVLTIEEAAQLMRIGRNSAYEAARRGEIPTVRIGRRLLVPRAALERMLAQAGMVHEERGGAHGR